ncbi:MAG: hypothetical protein IJN90_02110 [Bacilli bacterium]|nr:hypothetical protein [Bacilli bacterium]
MFKKIKELNKSKSIILTVTLVIVLLLVVGTTYAWLTSRTTLLSNTFTYGDIEISIRESDTNDGDEDLNTNSYVIMPGANITKDTKVVVKANSEDCYLFIRIDKENDFDNYMTYSLESNWKELEEYAGIYYMEVDKSGEEQTFNVIKDNIIKVKTDLTYADIRNITSYPTMMISAYAVQRNEDMDAINSPKEAWELAYNPAS